MLCAQRRSGTFPDNAATLLVRGPRRCPTLNEGRGRSPTTPARSDAPVSPCSVAQRRSGTFPDNAGAGTHPLPEQLQRSTKVGDVPRQRLTTPLGGRVDARRSTKVGDVPRQRRGGAVPTSADVVTAQRRSGTFPDNARPPCLGRGDVRHRSTKVGDVPRQRRAQRLPLSAWRSALNEGRGRSPTTPWGTPRSVSARCIAQRRSGTFPDNAVPDVAADVEDHDRSTKVGDVPRQRPGPASRRPSPALSLNEGRGRSPTTPSPVTAAATRPRCAQRRSGTFPDNAPRDEGGAPVQERRSTKVGDVPRQRQVRAVPDRVGGPRSTKVGDVPRQRPSIWPGLW